MRICLFAYVRTCVSACMCVHEHVHGIGYDDASVCLCACMSMSMSMHRHRRMRALLVKCMHEHAGSFSYAPMRPAARSAAAAAIVAFVSVTRQPIA